VVNLGRQSEKEKKENNSKIGEKRGKKGYRWKKKNPGRGPVSTECFSEKKKRGKQKKKKQKSPAKGRRQMENE